MNTFGRKFKVSIFGESHGEAIGVVLDGVQPGMPLDIEDFTADILRRKSGPKGTTPRIEADIPEIVSGVYNGLTTGAPLTILFHNRNTRSGDYSLFNAVPRPGHADYTASIKWLDFNDPRGGGHFSGRLTLPIVAAGVVAKKMVSARIHAELIEVGGVRKNGSEEALPDGGIEEKDSWREVLDQAMADLDSVGGIVECRTDDLPAGLGEPFFDSVESLVAHAIFAIPGVRGIEFGDGFNAARMKGSEHNDPLTSRKPAKNGAGGINGGITNGAQIVFRVAFKPTSSIAKAQMTLNVKTGETVELRVPGRHDTCFALRTPVIVEAVTAIVMADFIQG